MMFKIYLAQMLLLNQVYLTGIPGRSSSCLWMSILPSGQYLDEHGTVCIGNYTFFFLCITKQLPYSTEISTLCMLLSFIW
jgi:hypothetical protein